jgi:hypothetical protein
MRAAAGFAAAAAAALTALAGCSGTCRDTPRRYGFCETAGDANAVVQGRLASRGELSEAGAAECPTPFRAFTFEPDRAWPTGWDGGSAAFAVEGDLGAVPDGTEGLFFFMLSAGRTQLHVDGFYARQDGGFRLAGAQGNPLLATDEVLRQVQRVADGESCSAPASVP